MSIPYKRPIRAAYICSRCLAKSLPKPRYRPFSTSHFRKQSTIPPALPASGYTHLKSRGIISLEGQDADKFLQGLTTQNVDPSRDTGWYTGFLNAQGRVLYDAIVHSCSTKAGRQFLIEVDSAEVESLIKHLKKRQLRSKISIQSNANNWNVFAAWGGGGRREGELSMEDGSTEKKGWSSITALDPRLPAFGYRILLPKEEEAAKYFTSGEDTNMDAYTIRRYLHGLAEGPQEIFSGSALPLEANMDHLHGIDFRKGCYLGQELTIRTQHTGVVRKRILPVQLYTETPPTTLSYFPETSQQLPPLPEPGTDIKAKGGKRAAGKWLTGVGNVGLALCRLENMTDLRVSAEGGSWVEGMEFGVGDGGLKVKAFVPGWLREAEEVKKNRRKVQPVQAVD